MRIAHILPSLSKGGGERVAVDLANWAAANGHDVSVVSAAKVDETLLRNDLAADIAVRYITEGGSRAARYVRMLPWIWRNRAWLRSQDVVHCHMSYASAFGAALHLANRLTRRRRPLVVETYHAVGMPIPRSHRWLHARLAGQRDALVLMANDPYWRRFAARRPRLLSQTIPNGVRVDRRVVPAEETQAYRRAIGLPDSARWIVGTIGQLRTDRRPWLYPRIFATIAEALGPDAHFIIGGEGPERCRVEAAIAEAGLQGRVHLPGLVTDTAPPLSAMNLYLTVNIGAITGIAALEAAASGLPILAIQFDETYRATGDEWIWSSTDLHEIGRVAAALLKDPEALRALADRQHAHVVENRTIEAMAKAYFDLYKAAAARA